MSKIAEIALCIGLGAVVIALAAIERGAVSEGKKPLESIRIITIAICIFIVILIGHISFF